LRNSRNQSRLILLIGIGIIVFAIMVGITNSLTKSKPTVLQRSSSTGTAQNVSSAGARTSVPWDYKVEEAKVGDLIGGDMTILPNNQLLPNDGNYGTGDKVWVLSYMTAEMAARPDGRNDVTLSAWKPIKSFRTQEAAKQDLASLKVEVKTDVDLIGVYKTEYQGAFRQFAMLTLPSGHTIKQPIQEDRYKSFKSKKQVKVVLEEVHDFSDYDQAMAKFRGWAE